MDFNFDDLTNNNDLTDNNLSIDGMENWTLEDPSEHVSSMYCLDGDSGGGDSGGGGTDVAYGSSTFGFDGGGGTETAYGTCAFSDSDL